MKLFDQLRLLSVVQISSKLYESPENQLGFRYLQRNFGRVSNPHNIHSTFTVVDLTEAEYILLHDMSFEVDFHHNSIWSMVELLLLSANWDEFDSAEVMLLCCFFHSNKFELVSSSITCVT